LRTLLAPSPDLEFLESLSSLEAATALIVASPPDIVVLDKGFGMRVVLDWIHDLKLPDATLVVTVWGVSMTEVEVMQLLQAGVRGIVRKTADLAGLLACLRTVASGRSWLDGVFSDSDQSDCYSRSELTPRERQVLELVEQGFKNKEISLALGIRLGTVKVHLRNIFEKTGFRGRYGLAISGLKERVDCIDRDLRAVVGAEPLPRESKRSVAAAN
jgi:DNA-binding NarL/FixJ family response regulator